LGSESGSLDRLLEVVAQLEGTFLPWSAYERDILATRVHGYQPRLLDELCAGGEVAWIGRGSIGAADGRVALYRPDRLRLLAPTRLRLLRRSRPRRRALVTRGGPPEAAGRWSLVPVGVAGTDRAHALALTLLERHGVVTRESVLGEGLPGGFAAVYPVLRAMEEAGKIRRGYFVEGLGAAQFAMPGAVDRLRAERTPVDDPKVHLLAATDPASPYGSTIAWPKSKKLQRVAGAYLVLVDGEPALYVERGRRGLATLPAFEQHAEPALASL